jgi:hypothetical protein
MIYHGMRPVLRIHFISNQYGTFSGRIQALELASRVQFMSFKHKHDVPQVFLTIVDRIRGFRVATIPIS